MGLQNNCIVLLLLGLINLLLHRPVLLAASSTPTTAGSGGHRSTNCNDTANFNRKNFPAGFAFGTSSSSYQYEGGASEGGRTPSIWDTYTHKYPGKIADGSNGDVAVDSYHRYKEDVGIMKDMNLNAYRFSISWSRILPNGRSSGGINKEGIKFYNNLINELISNGITPYATLFHFDLPQTLEDEYGGFLSPRAAEDFKDYAGVCFGEFGDRVKYWMTFNEPYTFSYGGYGNGFLAPGRCSEWQELNCTGGDSGTEPYLVTHHQLLAHGAAVQLYKQKYQASQKGKIGIVLVTNWMVPFSNAKHDKNAALRALDFSYGWFMDPLTSGDYPHTMKSLVKKRLPEFTREQSNMIKGSFDFIGLNYYTSNYAANTRRPNDTRTSYTTDSRVIKLSERNGKPIGRKASSWLYVYPQGLYDLLLYIKKKYNNPLIYITENGVPDENNDKLTLEEALNDDGRVDYHCQHLSKLNNAIKDGVNVRGYFPWTLFDDFEWNQGYTSPFGMNYVDFKNDLKRYPKKSASWFKNFLKK